MIVQVTKKRSLKSNLNFPLEFLLRRNNIVCYIGVDKLNYFRQKGKFFQGVL